MESLAAIVKRGYTGQMPYPYRRPNPTNLASCRRYIWYLTYKPELLAPFSAELGLLFEEGRRQEDICKKQLASKYSTREVGTNLRGTLGPYPITGRPDLLVEIGPLWHLVEIKSLDEVGFSRLQVLGLKESHPYYYDQVLGTLLVVSQNLPDVYKGGAYLYARCRDSGDIHDEFIPWDDDWADFIQNEVMPHRAIDLSNPDRPPVRSYNSRSSSACQHCQALHLCWEPQEEKIVDSTELPEEAQATLREAIDAYLRNGDEKARVEGMYDEARAVLRGVLESHELTGVRVQLSVDHLVTPHFRVSSRTSVDTTRLRREFPEAAQQVVTETRSQQMRVRVELGGRVVRT